MMRTVALSGLAVALSDGGMVPVIVILMKKVSGASVLVSLNISNVWVDCVLEADIVPEEGEAVGL